MSFINTVRNRVFSVASYFRLGQYGGSNYIGDTSDKPALVENYQQILKHREERTVQDNKDRIYVSKASNKYEAQIREWEVNNKHSNLNAADNEKLGKLEVLSDLALVIWPNEHRELEKVKHKFNNDFYFKRKTALLELLGEQSLIEADKDLAQGAKYWEQRIDTPVDHIGALNNILRSLK